MATLICWSGLHGQPATSRPSVVLELYKKLEGPASIVLAAGDVGELGHQHPVLAGEKGVDRACGHSQPRPFCPCSAVQTRAGGTYTSGLIP